MSEPMETKPLGKEDVTSPVPSSPSAEEIIQGNEPTTQHVAPPTPAATVPTATQQTTIATPELTGPIKILKDAFPDLDVEVIEMILNSQGGNLDAAFETLLGMSDPNYKPDVSELTQQHEGMSQLRQDEEYARRLAREGDVHHPQNNRGNNYNNGNNGDPQQQQQQPSFNFQEELPIIKERIIEGGKAAKNKIMNFYNQYVAPLGEQPKAEASTNGTNGLASGLGNLSLSNNEQRTNAVTARETREQQFTDLYDAPEDQQERQVHIQNPLLAKQDNTNTSTPKDQLLSDEEYARQLAREYAETNEVPANLTSTNDSNSNRNNITNPVAYEPGQRDSLVSETEVNDEVTFSTAETKPVESSGYKVDDDDDLDDLFNKRDSTGDLKLENENQSNSTAASTTDKANK